jgi:DNA helicase-2/ATP-dependent DNA helicase PcrA
MISNLWLKNKYFYSHKKIGITFYNLNEYNDFKILLSQNYSTFEITNQNIENLDITNLSHDQIIFINLNSLNDYILHKIEKLYELYYYLYFNNFLFCNYIENFSKLLSQSETYDLDIHFNLPIISKKLYLSQIITIIYNSTITKVEQYYLPNYLNIFLNFLEVNNYSFEFKYDKNYQLKITIGEKTYLINFERFKLKNQNNIFQLTPENIHTIINNTISLEQFLNFGNKTINIPRDLDERQNQAATIINGPVRVLAPAGAGKTKTLISRILNLIDNGIHPSEILVLAFNKKAADEIRERLSKYNIQSKNTLWNECVCVKTFHALGYEIIRDTLNWKLDLDNSTTVQKSIITKALLNSNNIPAYKINSYVENFIQIVEEIHSKLKQFNPDETIKVNNHVFSLTKFFEKYNELQESLKYFSFEDMVYLSCKILIQNKEYREKLQNKFTYIFVDEFQDLNDSQFFLLSILSKPSDNIFVVGDDDQMIYSWRYANLEYILDFKKFYPISNTVILNTNYRCAKIIVDYANRLITKNEKRIEKNILPFHNSEDGNLITIFSSSIWEQAKNITNKIIELKENLNLKWNDFSILYRYHAFAFPLSMYMKNLQIPHTNIDISLLLNTNPINDLKAYLTLILHPEYTLPKDFERILFRPLKYLSHNTIFNIKNFELFQEYISENPKDNKILKDFKDNIKKISHLVEQKKPTKEILKKLDELFGFKEFYTSQFKLLKADEAPDNIIFDVLVDLSESTPNIFDFYNFINNPQTQENDTNKSLSNDDEITFSTIHSTKGNEYKYVVIFNFIKDKFKNKEQLEEERRLSYVALTRAKNLAIISTNKENYSIFLPEILHNPKYYGLSHKQLKNQLLQLKLKNKISSSIDINKEISQIEEEIKIRELLNN